MRENLNFLNALVWKISENINTGMILIVQRKTPVHKQFNEPFLLLLVEPLAITGG